MTTLMHILRPDGTNLTDTEARSLIQKVQAELPTCQAILSTRAALRFEVGSLDSTLLMINVTAAGFVFNSQEDPET